MMKFADLVILHYTLQTNVIVPAFLMVDSMILLLCFFIPEQIAQAAHAIRSAGQHG